MQQMQSTPGKLLIFINQMYTHRKLINQKSKGILKDMVMSNCKNILIVYEKYMKSGTELTLTSDLLQLIRLEKEHQVQENSTGQSNRVTRRASMPISIKIPSRNIQKLSSIPNRA